MTLHPLLSLRPGYSRGAPAAATVAQVVVVVDGGIVDHDSRLSDGLESVTVVDLAGVASSLAATVASNSSSRTDRRRPNRVRCRDVLRSPDRISVAQAETAARRLSPYRLSSQQGPSRRPRTASRCALAAPARHRRRGGLRPAGGVAPPAGPRPAAGADRRRRGRATSSSSTSRSRPRTAWARTACVIGATGSGKSELLRTLVLGLALTHSPETLNFVLVDFKGGATFARAGRAAAHLAR